MRFLLLLLLSFPCRLAGQETRDIAAWPQVDTLQKVKILDTCLLASLERIQAEIGAALRANEKEWRLDFYQSSLSESMYMVLGFPMVEGAWKSHEKLVYYTCCHGRYYFMSQHVPSHLIKKERAWRKFVFWGICFFEQPFYFSIYRDAGGCRAEYYILG